MIVPNLADAVSLIVQLAHARREGDAVVLDDAAPLFDSVPGLRALVHNAANGQTFGKIQGARSRDRKRIYEKRKVARAREYQKRRHDRSFENFSDSALKVLCGERLVRDPTAPDGHLRTLDRAQAIKAIDEGLALIATGRFELFSR